MVFGLLGFRVQGLGLDLRAQGRSFGSGFCSRPANAASTQAAQVKASCSLSFFRQGYGQRGTPKLLALSLSLHTYTYTYTYTHIHIYTYIHIYIYTYIHIYIYTYIHIYIYIYIYPHAHFDATAGVNSNMTLKIDIAIYTHVDNEDL